MKEVDFSITGFSITEDPQVLQGSYITSTSTSIDSLFVSEDIRHPSTSKNLIWEQRRYEMSKECFFYFIQERTSWTDEYKAKEAIRLADILINELKK